MGTGEADAMTLTFIFKASTTTEEAGLDRQPHSSSFFVSRELLTDPPLTTVLMALGCTLPRLLTASNWSL